VFRVRRAPLTSIKRGQANEPAPGATDMACACKLTKFLMASLMDVCEGDEGGADAVVQRLARPGGGNKKCAVVSIQSGAGLRMLCRQGYYWNQRRAKEPELQPSSPHPRGFARSTHHPDRAFGILGQGGPVKSCVTDFKGDCLLCLSWVCVAGGSGALPAHLPLRDAESEQILKAQVCLCCFGWRVGSAPLCVLLE